MEIAAERCSEREREIGSALPRITVVCDTKVGPVERSTGILWYQKKTLAIFLLPKLGVGFSTQIATSEDHMFQAGLDFYELPCGKKRDQNRAVLLSPGPSSFSTNGNSEAS